MPREVVGVPSVWCRSGWAEVWAPWSSWRCRTVWALKGPFQPRLLSESVIDPIHIMHINVCYTGTVAGDATALRHWQGRGHCSCPKPLGQTLPWEHLFPHSKAPRWEEPCDREMVTPCHLPRDSWDAGDQGNENLVELSLGMARGKQSCWFADFPGWPTNSKTIKARDTFLRSDPAQQSQGKIPTELNSHWTAATTVTYSQDLFIIPPWF